MSATYVHISEEEMDDWMNAQMFRRVEVEGTKEIVYEHDMDPNYAPDCRIRVYSSIVPGEGGRKVGGDAIRVVLVDPTGYVWAKGFTRVHRTQNWRLNMLRRYETIFEEPWNYKWAPPITCSECGLEMRCRHGKKGSFYGCSGYRTDGCRNTEAIG